MNYAQRLVFGIHSVKFNAMCEIESDSRRLLIMWNGKPRRCLHHLVCNSARSEWITVDNGQVQQRRRATDSRQVRRRWCKHPIADSPLAESPLLFVVVVASVLVFPAPHVKQCKCGSKTATGPGKHSK